MQPLLKGNINTFGGKAASSRLVAAKRVGAKAARATPEFISSSESRRDSMRSRAIDVNARAAAARTSPTDGPRASDDSSGCSSRGGSGGKIVVESGSGGHVGAGDDDGSVAVSVEGGNSRGG